MQKLMESMYSEWVDDIKPTNDTEEKFIKADYEVNQKIDELSIISEKRGFEAGFKAAGSCLREILGIK